MIKMFIRITLTCIIYLLIYMFLRKILALSEIVSISTLIIVIIFVQMKLGDIIDKAKLRTTGGEAKKVFEVSKKILTTLNTEEILDFLLDSLSEVISFNAAVIFLFDPETKKLYRKVSKGYDDQLDLTLKFGQGACGWVAKTRQVSLIKDIRQARRSTK